MNALHYQILAQHGVIARGLDISDELPDKKRAQHIA
jgi:hypothetical protein